MASKPAFAQQVDVGVPMLVVAWVVVVVHGRGVVIGCLVVVVVVVVGRVVVVVVVVPLGSPYMDWMP